MEKNKKETIKKKINFKNYKRFLLIILVILLMLLSFGSGIYITTKNEIAKQLAVEKVIYAGKLIGKYQEEKSGMLSQDIDFNLFWDTWDALQSQYVDHEEAGDKKLFYGALKGMVSSLKDPYTVFMDPKIAKDFSDDLAGTFEGIGAEIGIKNDILTIIAPLPGMPAEKAGLKAGDKIFSIDDVSTQGISIDEAVNRIRGPKQTEVILSISRKGLDEIKQISIIRGKIVVSSIRTELRDDNIFVIKILNFNNDTELAFNGAVREVLDKNPDGIILDLRNNPGGYLDTAIEVASEWVEDGIVVTEKYNEERKIEHLARGRARLKDFLTVVLVNEGSASASEIVSGALQDNNLAKLVGKKTFGKGSVQSLTYLDDGSSIKITVAKWLTPSGRSINDEGVDVDYPIEYSFEDYNDGLDPQIEAAVGVLQGNPPEISNKNASGTKEIIN
ncbi:S41 family peptidase [Candidatus Parcubacteria bacterium]|nr:S41 family peptidase [Candidatus Parcubacteria bacterium]